MTQDILTEFATGWLMDSNMAALSIRASDPIDSAQLIELCSGARTLFSLATLACRGEHHIKDCHRLWSDVLETFEQARDAWADLPIDRDPLLRIYVMQLERLEELATARVDVYTISESDRLKHANRRADTSEFAFGSRDGPKEAPKDWTDTRPVHIYSMGRL